MGFKELLFFCLLATPAMAYAASPIVCENQHTENQITSIWPTSCSRFGRVELLISSHPAQAGLFSTRPGENPA